MSVTLSVLKLEIFNVPLKFIIKINVICQKNKQLGNQPNCLLKTISSIFDNILTYKFKKMYVRVLLFKIYRLYFPIHFRQEFLG